jgi:peptidoglycan/xylan/chitin deacetylase (PgdA/CDA1 family)
MPARCRRYRGGVCKRDIGRRKAGVEMPPVGYDFCSMNMYARLGSMLLKLDQIIAHSGLAFSGSEGVLLSFLFHGLFDEIADSQQGITVEMFECFVEYFQRHSYTFVSPNEIAHGLDSTGKYVLITFDDGYFSNVKALPVLEKHGIPAALFVSTDHVLEGKAFWWDVVERESLKRRVPQQQVNQVHESLRKLRTTDAEAFVRAEFGPRALRPLGDYDRPFTLPELREVAKHPLISLGNHTSNHDILTNYNATEIRAQIESAQEIIESIIGQAPNFIAYPNGEISDAVLEASRSSGMQFGLSVNPGRNRLPIEPGTLAAMKLKRFALTGDVAIEPQCRASRSMFSLYRAGYSVKKSLGSRFTVQPA